MNFRGNVFDNPITRCEVMALAICFRHLQDEVMLVTAVLFFYSCILVDNCTIMELLFVLYFRNICDFC